MKAAKLPLPQSVVIPMAMHIGAPAKPVVKVGDHVKTGQLIGEAGGFVSAPIYASISGTVKKIGDMTNSMGRSMQYVEIESDGLDERWEGLHPPKLETMQDFLDAVRASGLVGLGGAGFPTVVKLTVKNLDQIQCVIINCAECEPYVTSDTRAMLDYDFDVIGGCRLLQKFLHVPKIVFGIEENKPECIRHYQALVAQEENMEVCPLPTIYPQGGEKILIYHVMHKVVEEGKLPLDVGAIVLNCTTISSIARYCRTGLPLVKKCVTVDGSAVQACRKTSSCRSGCGCSDVFEATAAASRKSRGKVIYGGTDDGHRGARSRAADPEEHERHSGADEEADATLPEPTACITLRPVRGALSGESDAAAKLRSAFKRKGNVERLAELKVNLCMECGCCAFGCPAQPSARADQQARQGAGRGMEGCEEGRGRGEKGRGRGQEGGGKMSQIVCGLSALSRRRSPRRASCATCSSRWPRRSSRA